MAFNISYIIEAIDEFSPTMRKIQEQTSRATRSLEKMSMVAAKTGRKMSSAGKSMTMSMSLPMAAFGLLAGRTAFDFDKSMNMVKAVTNSTGKQFSQLKEQAIMMGEKTQYSARQAAGAEQFLGLAGYKTQQILSTLPGVLQLAASAQLDMGDAANIVTNIMADYNLKGKDLAGVNNTLVKAFTSSKVNLQGLGSAFKMAGSTLGALHVPLKEATAAFGTLGKAGLDATMSGRGFRQALRHMIAPSTQAKKIMKSLNLTFTDQHGNLKDLIKLIDQLSAKHMKAGTVMKMFGTVGGNVMLALIQHRKYLDKLNHSLHNTGNISEKVAKAQMVGLVGATYKVRSNFEHLQIMLISQFEPTLVKVMNSLGDFMVKTADSGSTMRKLIGYFGVTAVAMGPVLLGLGKFIALAALFGKVGQLAMMVRLLGKAFLTLGTDLLLPVALFTGLLYVLQRLYAKFTAIKNITNELSNVLHKLVPSGPGMEAMGLITDMVRYGNIAHSKSPSLVAGGAISHQVKSRVDVNIRDKGNNVEKSSAMTDFGMMSLNVGKNILGMI